MEPIITAKSSVYHVFLELAIKDNKDADFARQLVRLLPQAIKEAKVGFDNIVKVWRYEYGLPITVGNKIVIGSNVFIEVERLYNAVKNANAYLTSSQLLEYLKNLENPDKHEDFLFEMRPLMKFKRIRKIPEHEVNGAGSKKIDWLFRFGFLKIVFDIKHRHKSLVTHMGTIIEDIEQKREPPSPPKTNPGDLFRSVESKFNRSLGIFRLQGVWIQTEIAEDHDPLVSFFKKSLDKWRIHFCIISNWTDRAFIITRNPLQKIIVGWVFNLKTSKGFTFKDSAKI